LEIWDEADGVGAWGAAGARDRFANARVGALRSRPVELAVRRRPETRSEELERSRCHAVLPLAASKPRKLGASISRVKRAPERRSQNFAARLWRHS